MKQTERVRAFYEIKRIIFVKQAESETAMNRLRHVPQRIKIKYILRFYELDGYVRIGLDVRVRKILLLTQCGIIVEAAVMRQTPRNIGSFAGEGMIIEVELFVALSCEPSMSHDCSRTLWRIESQLMSGFRTLINDDFTVLNIAYPRGVSPSFLG